MDAILAGWLLASTPTMALTYSVPAHIPTSAGDVSGTITTKGAPIGPGVRLEIRCGAAVYSAVTDSLGHYRVYVSRTGRCTLGLTYNDPSGSRRRGSDPGNRSRPNRPRHHT